MSIRDQSTASIASTLSTLRGENAGVYSAADLGVLLHSDKAQLATQRINWLINEGWIERVRNGLYVDRHHGYSPEIVGQRWLSPSYLTAEKALERHGLIHTGVLAFTYCTTRTIFRKEEADRIFGEHRFIYRHMAKHLYFGFESKDGVLCAYPEKAAIDFLYFYFKGSAMSLAVEDIDWDNVPKKPFIESLKQYRQKNFIRWAQEIRETGRRP